MTIDVAIDPWNRTRNGKPKVGATATREYTLTMEDTEAWAAMSQDYNPLHFDEQAAANSIFGRRVGHGGLMQGILHGIMGMELPGPGSVFLGVNWSFHNPILFGETITGEVKVIAVRDDKPITTLEVAVRRPDGTVCLDGTCTTYTSAID
ncbi:MaoC family dehydratase [Antrihabitans cavernicola]|uniref:MaoC family dehydratase n=1 Tax=Antrihabitans cavernicola TaxID=2495913 RepID=A0A5A7SFI6_9NOCA|nr:MaoC family dehydratase [Spelaeibacter cavernicola]KAA0024898.1 MaoC family dehydratase [Spelaeibacter cavernicola]